VGDLFFMKENFNPSLSSCYMTNLEALIGAFSLKFESSSKAYAISENAGQGSNLHFGNTFPLSAMLRRHW
jgi:hypothetical protein